MPKAKFLTPAQEKLIRGLGKWREYWNITFVRIGVKPGARDTHLTHIFGKFMQALELVAENPGIFDSRLRIHENRIKELERLRRKNIKEYRSYQNK